MPTTTLPDIQHLSVEEKLKLIELLWDSIRADPEAIPITPVQRAELERRLADLERNPDNVISREELRAGLVRR